MKKRGIKARLLGIVALLSIVSFGFFGWMASRGLNSVKESRLSVAKTAAENLIDKIDRNLFERYGDVQAFAVSEPARSGSRDRIVPFMNDMMGAYAPIYSLMMVVNLKGNLVAINGVDRDGKTIDATPLYSKDFSHTAWFKAVAADQVKPGTAFVEDLYLDHDVEKVYGGNGKSMSFTAPIRDPKTGKVLGIWTNRMSWDSVVTQISKEQADGVKDEHITSVFPSIASSSGLFLLHPEGDSAVMKTTLEDFGNLAEQLKGGALALVKEVHSGYFNGGVMRGLARSKGYSTYPGLGWVAAVEIPSEDPLMKFVFLSIGLAAVVILIVSGFATLVVSRITSDFQNSINVLTEESIGLKTTAVHLNDTSQKLASASTEQASSLQETASSVEEISAMVNKSAESARRSMGVAQKSNEAATKGKQVVEEMIESIGKISESNNAVMSQFEQSNQQLGNIIKVISEIGTKTKVINDIVFQTKLLSFNASVEAARAGEHGKGFAVVAEEVGNLAQMSGNAAKEIGEMLNGSIQTVQKIVDEAKGRIDRLVSENKTRIEEGITVAKQCGDVLEEIVQSESEINLMINEISTASGEQATGVNEINKAIGQLDQVTHENATEAQSTATQADQISRRAEKMAGVIQDLELTVNGFVNEMPSTSLISASNTDSALPKNVVPLRLNQKKASRPATTQHSKATATSTGNTSSVPKFKTNNTTSELKTAVGDGETLPSADDSRFDEM